MLSSEELEKALEACPAERITKSYIETRIKDKRYVRIEGSTVTICHLELDNGFSVRGESACVDPLNYDEKIGQKIAWDNAFGKLWHLFGFMLAEKRFHTGETA